MPVEILSSGESDTEHRGKTRPASSATAKSGTAAGAASTGSLRKRSFSQLQRTDDGAKAAKRREGAQHASQPLPQLKPPSRQPHAGLGPMPSVETMKKYLVPEAKVEPPAPPAAFAGHQSTPREEAATQARPKRAREPTVGSEYRNRPPVQRVEFDEWHPTGLGAGLGVSRKGPRTVRGHLRARRDDQEGTNSGRPGAKARPQKPSSPSTPAAATGPGSGASSAVGPAEMPLATLSASLVEAGVLPGKAQEIQAVASALRTERGQCRSIIWNLKRNAELLQGVNDGRVTAQHLLNLPHKELAAQELQLQRQQLLSESKKDVVVGDHATFSVACEACGNQEARGFMVHLSAGPLDNHRDSWTQMAMRGTCQQCGHVWVDGREC